jgi:metacaspase-1
MSHRIVWVHGIGMHTAGYSADWQTNFNRYLNLNAADYLEVCWDTVFHAAAGGTRSADGGPAVALSPQEQLAEQEVREELETILQARAFALQAEAPATTRGGGGDILEYEDFRGGGATTRGALDWLFKPDEYLGDFAKYLVSRSVRTAVKEKAKEVLRPLAAQGASISIVSHSWGTVVAYDALLDLEIELPQLKVANLITLGSPLWMVRRMLDDRSGRKPGQTGTWINVHARGDLIGSWLQPAFRDDRDFAVPNFGGSGAHSSYFLPDNSAVQRDIVAQYVLR